jgi:hypothetical protein
MYPYAKVYRLENSITKNTCIYKINNDYNKKITLFKLVNSFFDELNLHICNNNFHVKYVLKKGKIPYKSEFQDFFTIYWRIING